jgi:cyanophycinase
MRAVLSNRVFPSLVLFLSLGALSWGQSPATSPEPKPEDAKYQYFRVGNAEDKVAHPHFGIAMMGGGTDQDPAFEWMCQLADGGDFLILRATGTDAYNPYIRDLKHCQLNSVATIVIPNKREAMDRAVREKIMQAEAIFISGGDQANYVRYWQGTPVQDAINQRIKDGVPIGGTSAGLAVLTDIVFSALNDSAYSKDVLKNPYDKTVTLEHGFVKIPQLVGTISDQHFAKRDRFGRFVVFLARILQDGMASDIKGIAVEQENALLVDDKGHATLVGDGYVYFVRPAGKSEVCSPDTPLVFRDIPVYKINKNGSFEIASWKGTGGEAYKVSAADGQLTPNPPAKSIY